MPRIAKRCLPNPRIKYFVGEPVVVMPLAAVETAHDLLVEWGRRDRLTIQEYAQLEQKLKTLATEMRKEVRNARQYYRINSSHAPKAAASDTL